MLVKTAEFRQEIEHLYRVIGLDYSSCVGSKEVRHWQETAKFVLSNVEALECKRAKEDDKANWHKVISAAHQRIEESNARISACEAKEAEQRNKQNATTPYTLSIEPVEGKTFIHGYHLGTDLKMAKQIAAERFHGRNKFGMPTRTVAVMLNGKVVDCYDGAWSSEYDFLGECA